VKFKMPSFKMPKSPAIDRARAAFDPVVGFLNKRSTQEKQLIVGAVIVLGVALDFLFLVQPVARTLFEQAPKLPPLRQELKQLRKDLKDKAGIGQRWQAAQAELQEKEKQFVAADGAPALLENLSQEAQRSGVKITSLEPKERSAGEKTIYAPLPIEMKAAAGMHELGSFLSDLETGGGFFRVKDLRISSNQQNERKHLVQLSLETYKKEK
jgi:Tfp pilus assembly protein PilO